MLSSWNSWAVTASKGMTRSVAKRGWGVGAKVSELAAAGGP